MKLQNPLLVVRDMDRAVSFHKKVLGLEVILDFGANKTFAGGDKKQTNPAVGIPPPPGCCAAHFAGLKISPIDWRSKA